MKYLSNEEGFLSTCTLTFWSLDFQVEVEVYARAGFLLFEERKKLYTTIEILRVHALTLPLEILKLQNHVISGILPKRISKYFPMPL